LATVEPPLCRKGDPVEEAILVECNPLSLTVVVSRRYAGIKISVFASNAFEMK